MKHIFYENHLQEEAKRIREEVFVTEQGFREEFGVQDTQSIHLVLYEGEEAVACGRMYQKQGKEEWVFGRIAVLPRFRNRKLGRKVVELLEEKAREKGAEKVSLSAQVRVQGFYEKCGYHPVGQIYLDEHCEHIKMVKSVKHIKRACLDGNGETNAE